jgi:hypothetical protein
MTMAIPEAQAEARWRAYCDGLKAEWEATSAAMRAAGDAYLRAMDADRTATAQWDAALTVWETYRHGGPLAPADVVALLRAAGIPDADYTAEAAHLNAPHQVAFWAETPAAAGQIAAALQAAGYETHGGMYKQRRLGVSVTRGEALAEQARTELGLTPPEPPD